MTLCAQNPEAEVLAPKLTKWDKRVLAKLPAFPPEDEWREIMRREREFPTVTPWQVAEALREEDVRLVRQTLQALADFGYATHTTSMYPNPRRWYRTTEGNRCVA